MPGIDQVSAMTRTRLDSRNTTSWNTFGSLLMSFTNKEIFADSL
jgi:hypothetical protein